MEKAKSSILYAFLLALLLITSEANGSKHGGHGRRSHPKGRKLFVFGDSYADTGNLGDLGEIFTRCWYEPYGMTFPKKPAGRFSDGRIFTDFLAQFLKIKSPVPYKFRKVSSQHPYGMNFAVGGSGVFDTGNFQRNLSAQIDTFQEQINEGVFTKHDLESSIAYLSIAGNDYNYYYSQNHTVFELFSYIENVTSQLAADMKSLGEIGVKTVVAANLSPLECTPELTRASYNYKHCADVYSVGPTHHNELLVKAAHELNKGSNNTEFLILDHYSAFMSVIKQGKGARKFKRILKPCCEGKTIDDSCGWIDDDGEKLYSICDDPKDYFYFDSVHPTQAGWAAVFKATLPWLRRHLR